MQNHVLKARKFHDLMPNRVREILLVSSPYDAFALEEDGHLTEQIFTEYKALSLSTSPRLTYAPTGEEAMRLLVERRFDLVLTMTSVRDMDFNAFGRRVKELRPGRPVVLLVQDRARLMTLRESMDPRFLDGLFLWNGDAKILLAIIKYIEDRENVDFDIEHGDVRVILLLEDSPRFYSSYMALLYTELMAQSRSLYSEGVNQLHRLMCMKARPKILLADTHEAGMRLFHRYRKNVVSVMCDGRLPRDGVPDPRAGIEFARHVHALEPEVALLIQSAERENERIAREMNVPFIDKGSRSLLQEIRHFLSVYLGFGDFLFRLPDGRMVDRARDLRELEEKLRTVPEESIFFHATRNHFSVWLMARAEFDLAEKLRPRSVSEFADVGELRRYLIDILHDAHERMQVGVVADFDPSDAPEHHFSRIGEGSLGGKARGIAFVNLMLAQRMSTLRLPMPVRVPPTLVIGTDLFDAFIDENDLREYAYAETDDAALTREFVSARLPEEVRRKLMAYVHSTTHPLAVRSSSLLEDSMQQPFAGIYTTLMIPNTDPSPDERHRRLCDAVKLVYASTFSRNARSYLENTGYRIEEERMGVIIERVVGERHGDLFYPTFSGVAQSYNYYPIGPQKAVDGIAHVALGLGRIVVDGGLAMRFSPLHPQVLPQFSTPESMLANTQKSFYALNLARPWEASGGDWTDSVEPRDLAVAEADGALDAVGSVFDVVDRRIRDDLSLPGPRLVTFNNILKHGVIPLAETLRILLALAEEGVGGALEMEFAVDMGDWGRATRGRERREPTLYVLQIRPLVTRQQEAAPADLGAHEDAACLARSARTLGHGVYDDITDVVYVDPATWDASRNKAIAEEVGRLNRRLQNEKRPYLLVGPGRWGSADEWLGIPVQWSQIAGVRVMIEASPAGYDIDPSQGTHFFQNITALRIGYLTIPPGADRSSAREGQFFDWDWLRSRPPVETTPHLRLVRFDTPLRVVLDGEEGRGVVVKPES